jgi:retron-type reverse transcriptase
MRRAGNLYDNISELSNLELAFLKAQKGKSYKDEVMRFRSKLSQNLNDVRNSFNNNNIEMGRYHFFTIHDPKKRVICAAEFRERVMQHAVINICGEVFEKFQIHDSYTCRRGKGVDACLKRTIHFCKKYRWYLKMDIHKYFDSIDHNVLKNILNRKFKDQRLLNYFFNLIDTYETTSDRGIPIGNLVSQYFANLYLAVLDHEIKQNLKVPGYIRYMDDFICFSDDKNFLKETSSKICNFLSSKLLLELNPVQINKTACGIPFLSYRVRPNGLRLSLKAKRRFRKGILHAVKEEDQNRIMSLLAFVERADSKDFRKKVIRELHL